MDIVSKESKGNIFFVAVIFLEYFCNFRIGIQRSHNIAEMKVKRSEITPICKEITDSEY